MSNEDPTSTGFQADFEGVDESVFRVYDRVVLAWKREGRRHAIDGPTKEEFGRGVHRIATRDILQIIVLRSDGWL